VTEAEDSGGIPWWPWALLLLAAGGLATAVLVMQRRRQMALETWDRARGGAEDAAVWLYERLLPPVLADPGPSATATAWPAARPRFLDLDEQLTALARNAPDDVRRRDVGTLRSALADTAAALDLRAAAPDLQAWAAAQTRAELAADRLADVLGYQAPAAIP
jgi:hypothetical protein